MPETLMYSKRHLLYSPRLEKRNLGIKTKIQPKNNMSNTKVFKNGKR